MDIQKLLSEAAEVCGPSGQETAMAEAVAAWFRPLVDEVTVDAMFNVIAHKKGTGPKVMICAHHDEISLMVSHIEDDGCLRVGMVGGVDPRILPASRVWVHGQEKLFGTIGALPPHLMSAEDRRQNYAMKELYVDVGLPAEKVRSLVRVGDLVTFQSPGTALLNDQLAAKTMDDRSCVVMMLCAAERLSRLVCDADVYFVSTSQEEVGSRGAETAAFAIQPELCVALDGDFADQPGCRPDATVPIDTLAVSVGPFLQPKLVKRLKDCAEAHGVKLETIVAPSHTATDADEAGLAREGVPSLLLSLPMKYMHTTVETVNMKTLSEGGRLLAHFISELDGGWEDDLWI